MGPITSNTQFPLKTIAESSRPVHSSKGTSLRPNWNQQWSGVVELLTDVGGVYTHDSLHKSEAKELAEQVKTADEQSR